MISSQNNNISIGKRLPIEILFGYVSGFSVSPLVTIVDKSIVQNASGTETLYKSVKISSYRLVTQPLKFIKSPEQLWLFAVYSNTYASANVIDAICRNYDIPVEMPKLCITFLVNVSLSLAKDRALVRLFGAGKPLPVPKQSFLFWGIRDFCTVLFAFIMPPKLTQIVVNKFKTDSKAAETKITFLCPILLQIFTAPLHLLGLDYYNNRNNNMSQRIQFIQREYFKTALARMARMTPAYGIGGVLNLKLRQYMFGIQKYNKH